MLSVNVTVPSRDRDGVPLGGQREYALDYVESELSRLFGGATATDGHGAWLNSNGQLVKEDVTIVQSFADDDAARQNWPQVRMLAAWLKETLRQESVLISMTPVQEVEFV